MPNQNIHFCIRNSLHSKEERMILLARDMAHDPCCAHWQSNIVEITLDCCARWKMIKILKWYERKYVWCLWVSSMFTIWFACQSVLLVRVFCNLLTLLQMTGWCLVHLLIIKQEKHYLLYEGRCYKINSTFYYLF